MKQRILSILKWLGIYHPLQSSYRNFLFKIRRKSLQKKFEQLKGYGLKCNVCNQAYQKFEDDFPDVENAVAIEKYQIVAGYGKDIICPNCLSTARERLVLFHLQQMKIADKSILHLSPEKNIYSFIATNNKVVTADLQPGFYRSIDNQVQYQDATRLTFSNVTFDLLIANHVLEHIPDDVKAMREFWRVLKFGGQAILQVPYSTIIETTVEQPEMHNPAMQSKLFGQKDHVRVYALNDYVQRLQSIGFKVEVINEFKNNEIAFQTDEVFIKILKA